MMIIEKRKFERRFPPRQENYPGQLGDGSGNLLVSGLTNYNFVRISGTVQRVFNNRVPAEYDKLVTVGYDASQPGLFQVLSTRSTHPGGSANSGSGSGFAPASRYEFQAPGGGQDPLKVQLRQFMPHRVGSYAGLIVQVKGGMCRNGTKLIWAETETLDLSTYLPISAGKAALVAITVNTRGEHVATKGSEFTLEDIATANQMLENLPTLPDDTIKFCGATRVYTDQLELQEAHNNTDFIDPRFSWFTPAEVSRYTRWEPVTNGDPDYPEIVFSDGDIVMTEVDN